MIFSLKAFIIRRLSSLAWYYSKQVTQTNMPQLACAVDYIQIFICEIKALNCFFYYYYQYYNAQMISSCFKPCVQRK